MTDSPEKAASAAGATCTSAGLVGANYSTILDLRYSGQLLQISRRSGRKSEGQVIRRDGIVARGIKVIAARMRAGTDRRDYPVEEQTHLEHVGKLRAVNLLAISLHLLHALGSLQKRDVSTDFSKLSAPLQRFLQP